MTNPFARKNKKSDEKPDGSDDTSSTIGDSSGPGRSSRSGSSGSLKKWFFLATLVIGVGFLFSANALNATPIMNASVASLIMLPYCLFAWRTAVQTKQFDDFGDSCYFLGFLLTLVALVVSLIAFGSSTAPGNEKDLIVSRFGAAISTTLMGMLARILIAQFHDTPITKPEQVEAEIGETMARFAREIEDNLGHFKNIRSNTVNNINQATKAAETRINSAVEKQMEIMEAFTTEAFKRHEKIIDNLEQNLSSIVIDTGPMKESLEQSMGIIEAQMERLGDVLSNIGDSGSETEQQWAGLMAKIGVMSEALDQLKSGTVGLQQSGEQIGEAAQRIHDATDALDSSKPAVTELTEAVRASQETVTALKESIESNLQDIRQLKDVIGEEHEAARQTTEEVYKRLADALQLAAIKLEKASEEHG